MPPLGGYGLCLLVLFSSSLAEYRADISFLLKNITDCKESKLVVDVSERITHVKLASDDVAMFDVDSSTTRIDELIGLMSRANSLLSEERKQARLYVLKRVLGPGMVVSVSNGTVTTFEKELPKAEEGLDEKSIECVQVTGNRLILDSKLAPDYTDPYNMSSLMWAVILGDKVMAKSLIDKGADVKKAGARGVTPLVCTMLVGQDDVLDYMIVHNKLDLNASLNKDGLTLLHSAVFHGKLNCSKVLLRHGANPSAVEKKWGLTPLHVAVKSGSIHIVKALISANATLEAKDNHGNTALHFAAMGGHLEAIDLLLAAGADINSKDLRGFTPLSKAIFYNYLEEGKLMKVVQRFLQDSKLEVNTVGNDNQTVLMLARRKFLFKVAELLKEHGAMDST